MTGTTTESGFGQLPLPRGFDGVFTSSIVTTPRLSHRVISGGNGPALLLVNGWPQTWFAWRLVMPALAEQFTVVAVDPRGVGGSDKPRSGYDTGSMAADLLAVMAQLGHTRFRVVGHDVGMWTGFALASDHPDAVSHLVVAEATIPGVSPEPPFFAPGHANARLFHFGFNRLDGVNEQLVEGREHLYFGHQFATKVAPGNTLDPSAVDHYVNSIASEPNGLHASFGPYRAIDDTVAQNLERLGRAPITMPVLALGGAASLGEQVADTMKLVATNVSGLVLAGSGHYPAEERSHEFVDAVLPFLLADTDTPGELEHGLDA